MLEIEQIYTIEKALKEHFNQIGSIKTGQKFSNQCSSTYFDIRFFKKGTLHITFRDEYLWQEFNYRAAKYKGFPLPERMHKDAPKEENASPTSTLFS